MKNSTFRKRFPRRKNKKAGRSAEGGSEEDSYSTSGEGSEKEQEGERSGDKGKAHDRNVLEGWKRRPKEYTDKMKQWGNRMHRTATVPPVTRTYEFIEDYVVVEDEVRVKSKMEVKGVVKKSEGSESGVKKGKVRGRFDEKIVSAKFSCFTEWFCGFCCELSLR